MVSTDKIDSYSNDAKGSSSDIIHASTPGNHVAPLSAAPAADGPAGTGPGRCRAPRRARIQARVQARVLVPRSLRYRLLHHGCRAVHRLDAHLLAPQRRSHQHGLGMVHRLLLHRHHRSGSRRSLEFDAYFGRSVLLDLHAVKPEVPKVPLLDRRLRQHALHHLGSREYRLECGHHDPRRRFGHDRWTLRAHGRAYLRSLPRSIADARGADVDRHACTG
ncbi:hypothetical protein Golomagni_06613 [Golovinomyces magnicellulatus]|nr:hypothetical protein Golomagni_06613 [Golovinomyces magnicellulatus]